MRMNDKGLSLVEIVIVVAIMSVLTGLLTMGVSTALSKPADECAEKIVAELSNGRITTMGKQTFRITLSADSEGVYVEETGKAKKKIGQKGVEVKYKLTGAGYTDLDSTGIVFEFKRSTGGFKPVSGGSYCEEIQVSKGNRTKTIKLAYLTGKVTIDE